MRNGAKWLERIRCVLTPHSRNYRHRRIKPVFQFLNTIQIPPNCFKISYIFNINYANINCQNILSNNSKSSINQNQSVGPLTALVRTNGYEEIYHMKREIKRIDKRRASVQKYEETLIPELQIKKNSVRHWVLQVREFCQTYFFF